jgi:hypothetical protein
MAQFYGTIKGTRGEASRLGDKKNGFTGTVNGWTGGVRVEAYYDEDIGQDVFKIYATGGSKGMECDGYIGKVINGKFDRSY